MKLDPAHLKKALRNKDTWVVIGGAAAVVTAIAVLSGRNGSGTPAASYGYPNDQQTPDGGASSTDPANVDPTTLPAHDLLTSFTGWSAPAPAATSVAAPVPASFSGSDRLGNHLSSIAQIFAQVFAPTPAPEASAPAAATTSFGSSAPSRASAVAAAPAPAMGSDRWGNRVTLEELLNQGPLTNADARQAPPVTAVGSAYSVPDATPLYIEPIVARNVKTPGGGLAYPGGGTETYIGGSGAPMADNSQILIAA